MIIYHGHPSKPSLEKCRELAPSFKHGAEFSDKTGRRRYDEPYIIDNGAFGAYKNDMEWDSEGFVEMLEWTDSHPRDPDFVVVPDVVGDAEKSLERSREWASRIDYSTYLAVQDGMEHHDVVRVALDLGCEGLFVGGSKGWKKRTASRWVRVGNNNGLGVHLARPWDLVVASELGFDSCDTTTVVAWGAWYKLRQLEEQSTFSELPV